VATPSGQRNNRVADEASAGVASAATPSRPSSTVAASAPGGQPEVELDRVQRSLDHSRQALGRAEQKIKDLTKEAEALRDRTKQTERALDLKMEELEKVAGQHDSLRSLLAVRAERVRELEVTLTKQQDEALTERERLAADHERQVAELEEQMNRRLSDQMLIVADLRAQMTRFGTPRKANDDLERIRGIGPAYARKLHATGVTTFAQIASWSEADIDDVAGKLKIHGARIRRAGWVASAKALLGLPDTAPNGDDDEPVGSPI
jgi:predicted flap endonuclease-1-like 5' DNA nuclease